MSRHHTGQTPSALGSASAQYYAELQGRINSAPSEVQATINGYTGSQANTDRITQGAQAAASLAQSGYDPSSTSDNAQLVAMIAGGMCAAGPVTAGVSCALGGMVEGLWTLGNAIGCPVSNAFASVGLGTGCDFGCKTKGVWTPATVLSTQYPSPPPPSGSFAELAWGALAHYAAQKSACQGGPPPDVIVDAVVAMWNQSHEGPAEAYFVPPLNTAPSGAPIVASFRQWAVNGKGLPDPNVEYAFDLLLQAAQSPFWGGVPTYFGPGDSPGGNLLDIRPTPPRSVMVNSGPLTAQARPARTINLHISKLHAPAIEALVASPWIRAPNAAPTAGFFLPLAAGVGAALWLGNPLLAAVGLGVGLLLNRKF